MKSYSSETEKIRPKITKYFHNSNIKLVLDVGCGNDLIVPYAVGIDARPLDTVQLVTNSLYDLAAQLPEYAGKVDMVFSSHALEHLGDDIRALRDWMAVLRDGGYLVLYLPDDRYYNNAANPDHVQVYTHDSFLARAREHLGWEPVESGLHVEYDCYSFWVVYQKKQ